jgi:hypothetical protein
MILSPAQNYSLALFLLIRAKATTVFKVQVARLQAREITDVPLVTMIVRKRPGQERIKLPRRSWRDRRVEVAARRVFSERKRQKYLGPWPLKRLVICSE